MCKSDGITPLSEKVFSKKNYKNYFNMSKAIFNHDIIKNLPTGINNPLTPIVYAENAFMPAQKSKQKKCFVVITNAGVYFVRSKLGHAPKVASYISIFAITELEKIDETKRIIRTKNVPMFFIADHADAAVVEILKARATLFQDFTDPHPISVKGYTQLPKFQINEKIQSITLLRYFCLAIRSKCNVNTATLDFLKDVDQFSCRSLVFPPVFLLPQSLKVLFIPLGMMRSIAEVGFDNLTPQFVCRVAHSILKKTNNIRHIKFINYTADSHEIVPEQLRLNKIRELTYSFSFINCHFPIEIWKRFLEQFTLLKGNVIRLAINDCKLTPEEFELIISYFPKCRCFRTIERLEIDGIKFEGTWRPETAHNVYKVLRNCRFLALYSISNWVTPTTFSIADFFNAPMLNEISLKGQDMSQQTLNFTIPPSVRTLDLTGAHFTYQSLRSFLTSLSLSTKRLTLSLADIILPEGHWETLYDTLSDIPRSRCIYELDLSGHPMPAQYARPIGEFWLKTNPVSYLILNRIFTSNSISSLADVLASADKRRIWGLSLQGSSAKTIGTSIPKFLQIIDDIPDLASLDLTDQLIGSDGMKKLISFLKKKNIKQIMVDGSTLDSMENLWFCYQAILNTKKIEAISRPISDLKRLNATLTDINFKKLQQLIKPFPLPPERKARDMYYGSKDATKKFNREALQEFQDIYPLTLLDPVPSDEYLIYPDPSGKARTSLYASSIRENRIPIDDIQHRAIKSIKEPSLVPPDDDMFIPECLKHLRDHPGFFKRGSHEFDITKQMNFERLAETPEVQNALDQLAETVEIEDPPDKFDEQVMHATEISHEKIQLPESALEAQEQRDESFRVNLQMPGKISIPVIELIKPAPVSPSAQPASKPATPPVSPQPTPTPTPPPTPPPPAPASIPIIEPQSIKPPVEVEAPKPEPIPEPQPQPEPPKPAPAVVVDAPLVPKLEQPKSFINPRRMAPKTRKTLKEWSNKRLIIPNPFSMPPIQTKPASDIPPSIDPILPPQVKVPEIRTPTALALLTKSRPMPTVSILNPFNYAEISRRDSNSYVQSLPQSSIPQIKPIFSAGVSDESQQPVYVHVIDEPLATPLISLPAVTIAPLPQIDEVSDVKKKNFFPTPQPKLVLLQSQDRTSTETVNPITRTQISIKPIVNVSFKEEKDVFNFIIPNITVPVPSVVPHFELTKIPPFVFTEPIEVKRVRLSPAAINISGPPTEW